VFAAPSSPCSPGAPPRICGLSRQAIGGHARSLSPVPSDQSRPGFAREFSDLHDSAGPRPSARGCAPRSVSRLRFGRRIRVRQQVRLGRCGLALLLLLSPALVHAQAPKSPEILAVTGVFSDMHYVEESGDLVGTEIFIVRSSGHHFALVQVAEGTATDPVLVPATVVGNSISFELPECGRFQGHVHSSILEGGFSKCPNWVVRLPRRPSYWQQ
jgi:hypothetical protein